MHKAESVECKEMPAFFERMQVGIRTGASELEAAFGLSVARYFDIH